MRQVIRCVWEHHGEDSLLHAIDYAGAFTRGPNRACAEGKMGEEIASYLEWSHGAPPDAWTVEVVQEKVSDLRIADADSDVLFEEEKAPLSEEEYRQRKALVLKSAEDFWALYQSVPNPDASCLPSRTTFYGPVPRTAREMYQHTKNVNAYYFGEIGVHADNTGTIAACRKRGFERLEQSDGFLNRPAVEGSYGEMWSLRKLLRRFLWHDRIHAKAMYRMAMRTFGACDLKNPFRFREKSRKTEGSVP